MIKKTKQPKQPKQPNLPDTVSKLFLSRCTTEEVFENGRLNRNYFRLLSHFKQAEQVILTNLITYLDSLTEVTPMTVADLYLNAERFRQEIVTSKDRAINAAVISDSGIPYAVDKFLML